MRGSARGIGGGAKRCTLGKSCGATCIDAQERCNLELGPIFQADLPKARNLIERAKYLNNRDLDWDDKQAVKWTKANINNINSYMLDHLEGGKGSLWLIGNEPGTDRIGTQVNRPEIYQALRKKYPNMSDEQFNKQNWEKLMEDNAPLQARLLRAKMEESRLAGRALGRRLNYDAPNMGARDLSNLEEMLATGQVPKGWKIGEEIDRFGSVPGINSSTYLGKGIKLADAIGATSMSNTNVSWLPSPNENVWPWGKMFERAGVDPGPFKSRSSWIKYSIDKRGDLIKEKILKGKPENVYVSGGNGKAIFDKLAADSKPFQTTVSWVSPNGNEKKATFTVAQVGDSRIVHGPHFTAQMPRSVIDMRIRLMKGERPENAVGVQPASGAVRPMKVAPAKVAKDTAKELVAPKVAAKPDPVAARQKFNGYVQTLRNQGQSPNQIREYLRKIGVPTALITELV